MPSQHVHTHQTFVKSQHKFGVLCVRQDQRTEEEIFSNSLEAGPFDEFLKVLGNCQVDVL